MNPEIEKKIDDRVAAAFADLVSGASRRARNEILRLAADLVRAAWHKKIYTALPADKTKVREYFLDQELEQFLNEAVEECHHKIQAIADGARREFDR